MADTIKYIDTNEGPLPIDYTALANLPAINNNMLINGDFKINQRGSTSYIQTNTWKYSVDRWKYIGLMTVTVNESGTVTLSKSDNNNKTYFSQQLEDIHGAGNFTFSFRVKSISGIMEAYIEGGDGGILTVTAPGIYQVSSSSGTKGVHFRLAGSTATVELQWAKLEVGTAATQFVSRLRAEELMLCRRYFDTISGIRISGGECHTSMNCYIYNIPKDIGYMANRPTMSAHGITTANSTDGICVRNSNLQVIPGFTFTYLCTQNVVTVTASANDANAVQTAVYDTQLYSSEGFILWLDSEIY